MVLPGAIPCGAVPRDTFGTFVCIGRNDTEAEVGSVRSSLSGLSSVLIGWGSSSQTVIVVLVELSRDRIAA